MRVATILLGAAALSTLVGCHKRTAADKVEHYYDRKAAEMDNIAAQQPTKSARQIYEGRADALRKEGEDREKGLRKAGAGSDVPRLSNIEDSLPSSPQGTAQQGSVTPPPVQSSPQQASPMQAARPSATPPG